MKKIMGVIAAVVVLTVSGLAFAQMDEKGKAMMKDKAGMMEGKGMMKMCHAMMNKPSMVAVGDGVVVLAGKKLYKYDANLNLVKEADVKMEDGMMGKGMGMMDMDDKAPEAAGDAKVDEHAEHHPKE